MIDEKESEDVACLLILCSHSLKVIGPRADKGNVRCDNATSILLYDRSVSV